MLHRNSTGGLGNNRDQTPQVCPLQNRGNPSYSTCTGNSSDTEQQDMAVGRLGNMLSQLRRRFGGTVRRLGRWLRERSAPMTRFRNTSNQRSLSQNVNRLRNWVDVHHAILRFNPRILAAPLILGILSFISQCQAFKLANISEMFPLTK